ncbi:MAG: M23 family metallopeptidase [Oscillospiraceae bacterium]|nr:M23 family metallopeptidase [Oscillospiraceae bacterium]
MVRYPMQRIGVTAGFGLYDPRGAGASMHYAVDISRTQPKSFDVTAAHDGTVLASLFDTAGGNLIALRGGYNEKLDVITRYGHLLSRAVRTGDAVRCGDVIGVQGNTGTATTAQHLHFETWLVPKTYAYRAADRPLYAVDPLGVCQLGEDQQFVRDACTRGYAALPYPEPKLPLRETAGTLRILGNPAMYFYPSAACSPYVSGYTRCKSGIADFFGDREFPARYTCENNGAAWAYAETPYGWVWVPLRQGESELVPLAGQTPGTEAQAENGADAAVQAKLKAYDSAVRAIRAALAAL